MTLVGFTLALGVVVVVHPRALGVDRWALSAVGGIPDRPPLYSDVVALGAAPAGIVTWLSLCLVAAVRERRLGVVSLAALPAVFVATVVTKDVVGLPGLGYPSGHVSVIAALCTLAVLVVPGRVRLVVAAVAAAVLLDAVAAVIVRGWHDLTEAVGGAALGAGVVLVLDGLSARIVPRPRSRRERRPGLSAPG